MTKRKTKKKNKKLNIVGKVIGILLLIVNIVLYWMIFKVNLIPTKYFTILTIILVPLFLVLELFLLKPKIKKGIKTAASIISVIIICLFSVAGYYLYNTYDLLRDFKFNKYQTQSYYLIVLDNNGFDKLEDIDGGSVGLVKTQDDAFKQAIEKLETKVSLDYKPSDDVALQAEQLLDDELDALFIDDSYKSFLSEQVDGFDSKTKVLYTVEVKTEKQDIAKKVDVTKEAFNIYISGIDTSGNITNVSRSDVNMVMTINPNTNQILLTSIPRDYYVQLHGTTGLKDKLTHSGTYGINMTVQTVEDLLDIDINYYIRVNFTTLIKLVDVIGGIDVYSDKGFTPWTNNAIFIPKGNVHMDGAMALAFARERHAYTEGDRHRIQNQQDVLEAVFKKITNTSTLVTKYSSILDTLGGAFETNLSQGVISSLAKYQINSMPSWNIEKISVNGRDSSNYTYSYAGQKLYVMEPDMTTVTTATSKIKEVLNAK